jgi:hypothetical protein
LDAFKEAANFALELQSVVSADHTVQFRRDIQPFIGAPYDERLYH